MAIDAMKVKSIIYKISEVIGENKEYLTELDAAIGDGDHGINMTKGFKKVVEKLETSDNKTPEDVLKMTAMTLISNVGGAAGPLYGTLFLKASSAVKGKNEIGLEDFSNMLEVGIEGVKHRGKSDKGEKTMLDVLIPVYESISKDIESGLEYNEIFENALKISRERIEYTKTIAATKGRASYLGDRSIGHIDPGAMSSHLMFETIFGEL